MAWTLAGVTIHVGDKGYKKSRDSLYAIQHVLDDTTDTISYYGAGSPHASLDFILDEDVNSNTGYATLEAAEIANSNAVLVSNVGTEGNYRIINLNGAQVQALNHTNRVWECSCQLIKV